MAAQRKSNRTARVSKIVAAARAKATAKAGKKNKKSAAPLPRPPRDRNSGLLVDRARRAEEQLRAVRALGAAMAHAVGIDAVLAQMVPQVSRLMNAARTTLFFYDRERDEIWSKVAEGVEVKQIRLQLGQGIAGWVAAKRQLALVTDAYDDPRFNRDVDQKTGFRTRSVAAAPLLDRKGNLLGVLQVLNRRGGPFTSDDGELLQAIAAQAAHVVENAHLAEQILERNRELDQARQRAEQRRAELDLLYQIEQETTVSANLDELLDSIIVRVCDRLRSQAGSVLLTDQATGRLFFRGVTGEHKEELKRLILEPGQGIVGHVAETGEPLIVNRPEDDPRHARQVAAEVKVAAQAILAVPLVWDKRVIGAIEVLNPTPRESGSVGYDLEDLKILSLIAGQVARAVSLTQERQARLHTERLAVVGRMLAGVAHDLRNPMTVISGLAQLMAMEDDAAERDERCKRILGQVDEMTTMIGDLLSFARGDTTLRPSRIEVSALAKEIEESLLAHCAPRRIKLRVERTMGIAEIDLNRVKRIVYNLAKNAIDVLGAGGGLHVELHPNDRGLAIEVRDDGPGIPENVRNHLFEPFFTAGKAHGTGLGLSIVKRFVEDHAGRIEVDSAPGKGTTFTIHLPRAVIPATLQA